MLYAHFLDVLCLHVVVHLYNGVTSQCNESTICGYKLLVRLRTMKGMTGLQYRTCMANSAENKSFCEVPKYVINTRPHCPKLMKFTCYTHAQSCNTESCICYTELQIVFNNFIFFLQFVDDFQYICRWVKSRTHVIPSLNFKCTPRGFDQGQ